MVILAFAALAYGWVQGIDPLLYGSIALSGLAGVALLRSTMVDRRKLTASRQARRMGGGDSDFDGPGAALRGGPLRSSDRKSLAELGSSKARGQAAQAESNESFHRPRTPIRPFGDTGPQASVFMESEHHDEFGPDVEGVDLVERTLSWVESSSATAGPEVPAGPQAPRPRTAPSPADDFRARLASVLGDSRAAPPPGPRPAPQSLPVQDRPPTTRRTAAKPAGSVRRAETKDEIETDWIRIEDVPRIARATQAAGGYARPDLAPVQPPRRRTEPARRSTKPAAPIKPAAAKRRTASPKAAAKPPASKSASPKSRTGPAAAAPRVVKPGAQEESPPRTRRPKP